MDAERSSLCNFFVNFLMEENYLLTAFELLHELLDDGRDAQAIRLKEFFSDPARFPPDQISRYNSIRGSPVLRHCFCIRLTLFFCLLPKFLAKSSLSVSLSCFFCLVISLGICPIM